MFKVIFFNSCWTKISCESTWLMATGVVAEAEEEAEVETINNIPIIIIIIFNEVVITVVEAHHVELVEISKGVPLREVVLITPEDHIILIITVAIPLESTKDMTTITITKTSSHRDQVISIKIDRVSSDEGSLAILLEFSCKCYR